MSVKPTISEEDFPRILSSYNLGEYEGYKTFANGAGQTTVLLLTSKGKFVLRYYENRPQQHVEFEINLFDYLKGKSYPVPEVMQDTSGNYLGIYKDKPYVIIEYIVGEHGKNPNDIFDADQATEVVKAVAQLHNLTKEYPPEYLKGREVYDTEYCWREYKKYPQRVENKERENWLRNELDKLEFPGFLPKGICHAELVPLLILGEVR